MINYFHRFSDLRDLDVQNETVTVTVGFLENILNDAMAFYDREAGEAFRKSERRGASRETKLRETARWRNRRESEKELRWLEKGLIDHFKAVQREKEDGPIFPGEID